MDYATLKAEIALPAYDGLADEQIADALNARTVAAPAAPVPILALMVYLRDNGLWLPIKAAAAAGTSQGATAAVDYNDDPRAQTLDMSLPIVGAMLADLMAHSPPLLSQAQADALVAMATPPMPYLATIGWTVRVTANDIAAARDLP